jgi:hypothetical protein
MRDRRIIFAALCGLLVTMIGCQVQQPVAPVAPVQPASSKGTVRVQVDPVVGAFNYAYPGETLEFNKLFPGSSDFYVIFVGISPCEKGEMYLTLTGNSPASCKIKTASTYQYYLSATLPLQLKGAPAIQPRICPACQFIVVPPPGGGQIPPPAGGGTPPPVIPKAAKAVGKVAAPPNYAPVSVTCDSGTVTVAPVEQSPGNGIVWLDNDSGSKGLTVTLPSGTCSGSNVFGAGLPGCILLSTAKSTSYTVDVQDSSCKTPGTGQLTVTTSSK